jgi:hypothetical protein
MNGSGLRAPLSGASIRRALMAMVGGIVLLSVFLLFGRLWGGDVAGLAPAAVAS